MAYEPEGIFAAPSLMPTFVIAAGVELSEDDDGNVSARYVNADVIVGQLGIAVPENLQNKSPLSAGSKSTRDSVILSEATNGSGSGMIGALEVATESPPSTVGDRLRRAMLARSMTVEILIAESGISKATIYRLLRDGGQRLHATHIDTVISLTNALSMDGWWFETGQGEPPHGNDSSKDHEG